MKTKNSFLLALGFLGLSATYLDAQVAINNSAANPNASAILDLQTGNAGVNKGFLPQSVALTNVTVAAPVTSPATGLIVYSSSAPTGGNGAGYYFWDGTSWASMNSTLMGSGTNNYVARWTPNGSTLGTGMIQDNGATVGVNNAPVGGTMIYVNGGTGVAIEGVNTGSAAAIYGSGPNWIGVEGYATVTGDVGTWGEDDAAGGYGIYGLSTGGTGTYGYSGALTGYGVYAYNGGGGTGLWSYGDTGISAIGTFNGINAYGVEYGINDTGYVGENASGAGGIQALGTIYQGVYGQGSSCGGYFQGINGPGSYNYGTTFGDEAFASAGIGVSGTGTTYGVYGTDGTNYAYLADNANGYGVTAYGTTYGGYFSDAPGDFMVVAQNGDASYFQDNAGDGGWLAYGALNEGAYFFDAGGDVSYLAYAGYGILSSSVKSTMVKDNDNNNRIMYCTESPEVKFEDYGEGQLVNGKAHITLDPLLAKNVSISQKHPLQAFVQLEGDCNGVYVTNKTAAGFDVIELNHGTSNTSFSWHIVANRADKVNAKGATYAYSDWRFPVGPVDQTAPAGKKMGAAKQAPVNAPALSSKHMNTAKATKRVPLMSSPQKAQESSK